MPGLYVLRRKQRLSHKFIVYQQSPYRDDLDDVPVEAKLCRNPVGIRQECADTRVEDYGYSGKCPVARATIGKYTSNALHTLSIGTASHSRCHSAWYARASSRSWMISVFSSLS